MAIRGFAIEIAESEETRIQGVVGTNVEANARSLESEHRLAQVIGQMVRAA